MKKPRLFYYCDCVDAWVPTDHIQYADVNGMDPNEVVEVQFKRFDMTDEEFANIQED
jgi:hypothetical protein